MSGNKKQRQCRYLAPKYCDTTSSTSSSSLDDSDGEDELSQQEEEEYYHRRTHNQSKKKQQRGQTKRQMTVVVAMDKKRKRDTESVATAVDSKLVEKLDDYKQSLVKERANYINNWNVCGHYCFRSDPFNMRWEQQQPQEGTEPMVKRAKTEESSVEPPLLYQLLDLSNENFATQFFIGLGPMELMNLYRVSRRVRSAMIQSLADCVRYVMNKLQPEAMVREISELNYKLYKTIVKRSALSLTQLCNAPMGVLPEAVQSAAAYHYLVPLFLELVHLIHCHMRVYSTLNARYCTNATDKVVPELTFLVRDEPRWRVAPLSSANVFVARVEPHDIDETVAARLVARYGQSATVACDMAWNAGPHLFRHQDWIDVELVPATSRCERWGPLRLSPDRLFVVDAQRSAITQLREPPYVPGRLSLNECQLPAESQGHDLYALELAVVSAQQFLTYASGQATTNAPIQPFIDHYEVRLAAEARSQPLVDAERRARLESEIRITADVGGELTDHARKRLIEMARPAIDSRLAHIRLHEKLRSFSLEMAAAVNLIGAQFGLQSVGDATELGVASEQKDICFTIPF